jgi:hypothetical protein
MRDHERGELLVNVTAALIVVLTLHTPSVPNAARPTPFDVQGRTAHWEIRDTFYPSELSAPGAPPSIGYAFSPTIIYRGPAQRVLWYRMEPLFPQRLTIRVGERTGRGACIWDVNFVDPSGELLRPGRGFPHGRCLIDPPGDRSALKKSIRKGLYHVAWEDDKGVHSEAIHPNVADRNPQS